MRRYLKILQPSTFEELIALNTMYRPRIIDCIDGYTKRKHGLEAITYDHPMMEKYLKETYGVTIYQEQLMLLSQEIANFTPEESDLLIRAVFCRRLTQQETAWKEKFIRGGMENGYTEEFLEEIWRDWMRCGNYLFNKSHAVCYTWLAYKMAYLKAHYPEEFMQAYFTINDKAI
jgi:DNA polymerase-3 subunit alpha